MDFKKLKSHSDLFLFFFVSILYMELILRGATCDVFFTTGLIFLPLFSACAALIFKIICSLFGEKVNRILTGVIITILFILFATQAVYHDFFGKYLIVFSLTAGGADQIIADGLLSSTISAIIKGLPTILILSFPLILFFTVGKKRLNLQKIGLKFSALSAALVVVMHLITVGFIYISPSDKPLYFGAFDPNLTVSSFGLMRTEAMDLKFNLLGIPQKVYLNAETDVLNSSETGEANIQDIDFSALINNETDKEINYLHQYFSTQSPSYKNDYTGYFEGYNLIFMVAEGFSPYAVDKDLTPNLYKMSTKGFNFTNFYTPLWGVSTSDGEYTACTGLIPKSGVWSFYKSSQNLMPYCLGNQFKESGVENLFSYHNNTHSFYHRDLSHPNMGYTYKGVGNGLEAFITDCWPQSDLEMINGTADDFISSDKPFHAYYMTVSGHLEYDKTNAMVRKNWDLVKDLDVPDKVKAYYAANIEFDKAVGVLMKKLEAAGVADKTVIAITPDHYPYGLEEGKDEKTKYKYFDFFAGHKIDTDFELYKSNFLIYCPSVAQPVTVTKYCSSLDVLPTLLNLFGFSYDSRLLMGNDILSSSEDLVIFADRSFITSKGKYNASENKFTPHSGVTFKSDKEQREYIEQISNIVNNKFQISALILDTDYYSKVLNK